MTRFALHDAHLLVLDPGRQSNLALRDIVFVLTSCSVDYWPLNNARCTPLQILVIAG